MNKVILKRVLVTLLAACMVTVLIPNALPGVRADEEHTPLTMTARSGYQCHRSRTATADVNSRLEARFSLLILIISPLGNIT